LIPVYEPDLGDLEKKYVNEAMDSGWISSKGAFIDKFEMEFARLIGYEHPGISVSNGTVALHLALLALDIGPGDEVLVPNFTYVACANSILYMNARPVFFDSLVSDLQPSSLSLERLVSHKTKAIILPHLYGAAADVKKFVNISKNYNIPIVEDCAEGIGTRVEDKHIGNFGDIATFSFFGNKTLTTGEGGMVFAKNLNLDNKIRKLKNQGLTSAGSYFHDVVGYNYRMTNIQAAIGLAQVERVDEILKKKVDNHHRYLNHLKSAPHVRLLETSQGTSSYWIETLIFEDQIDLKSLSKYMHENGVETRPGFSTMKTLPMFEQFSGETKVSSKFEHRVLNLPSSPKLSDSDIATVCKLINSWS
jgi:perosamine synthetase